EAEPTFHLAKLAEEVYERDSVRTGPRSKVKIFFHDESLLFLGENSEVQLKKFEYARPQKERLAMIRALGGKVRFLIAKLMPTERSRFELETPTAIMGARGTDGIAVMKSPTQAICLSGEIYVQGLGRMRQVILTPYQMTVVEEGQDPLSPFPVDTEYLLRLLEDFRMGAPGVGPGSMTDTITAVGGVGPAGPETMTETIQTWRPDQFSVPPVLLEPPAGMSPSLTEPEQQTRPHQPGGSPGGSPGESPPPY
ncbi:MAG: FecR family protein, partial [candidate division NC10 bacterium]|nr:FecR family protein [candidate division NC10 bacterium]